MKSDSFAALLHDGYLTRSLLGRSMLLTQDWSPRELDLLLGLVARFEQLDRQGASLAFLPNELALALFFDHSTRTRTAWAGAAARLGMQPVVVDGSSTQVSHGETAEETGAMIGMNSHAMGVRHDLILGEGNTFMRDLERGIQGYLRQNGESRSVPVVNLQCDVDHPTQTLADLAWLQERFPQGLAGRKITVSWAYSPSYAKPLSVPQGLAMLMTRQGAHVTLAHPPGYELLDSCLETARANARSSGGSFRVSHDMDDAFQGAHVVYPKSWGPHDLMLERVEAHREGDDSRMAELESRALARNATHRDWICDESRMARTADALYMHCLPADIGDEVSPAVMDRFRFHVAREANKKVYVIMALVALARVPDLAERVAGL